MLQFQTFVLHFEKTARYFWEVQNAMQMFGIASFFIFKDFISISTLFVKPLGLE